MLRGLDAPLGVSTGTFMIVCLCPIRSSVTMHTHNRKLLRSISDVGGCLSNHPRLPVAAPNRFQLAFQWLLSVRVQPDSSLQLAPDCMS